MLDVALYLGIEGVFLCRGVLGHEGADLLGEAGHTVGSYRGERQRLGMVLHHLRIARHVLAAAYEGEGQREQQTQESPATRGGNLM